MGYTVEQFGLLLEPELQRRGDVAAGYTSLKESNYLCLPLYWSERPDYRVQVWRTRIFDCPLVNFPTSLSSLFGPARPVNMYMEECWHPNIGKERSLTWFEHRYRVGQKIDQFRKDALLILGDPKRIGRSKKYGSRNDFILDLKEAYEKVLGISGDDPTQLEVASEMKIEITLLTFQRRLKEHGIPWPPSEIF